MYEGTGDRKKFVCKQVNKQTRKTCEGSKQ